MLLLAIVLLLLAVSMVVGLAGPWWQQRRVRVPRVAVMESKQRRS